MVTLSRACSLLCWRNTRSRSHSSISSRWVWTGCNGTLNPCVNKWRMAKDELTDVPAAVVIYEAFVEGKLEAPKHLARTFLPIAHCFNRSA